MIDYQFVTSNLLTYFYSDFNLRRRTIYCLVLSLSSNTHLWIVCECFNLHVNFWPTVEPLLWGHPFSTRKVASRQGKKSIHLCLELRCSVAFQEGLAPRQGGLSKGVLLYCVTPLEKSCLLLQKCGLSREVATHHGFEFNTLMFRYEMLIGLSSDCDVMFYAYSIACLWCSTIKGNQCDTCKTQIVDSKVKLTNKLMWCIFTKN